jgi:hypothetical protein
LQNAFGNSIGNFIHLIKVFGRIDLIGLPSEPRQWYSGIFSPAAMT